MSKGVETSNEHLTQRPVNAAAFGGTIQYDPQRRGVMRGDCIRRRGYLWAFYVTATIQRLFDICRDYPT